MKALPSARGTKVSNSTRRLNWERKRVDCFLLLFFSFQIFELFDFLFSLSFCFHPNFSTPPGEPTDQRLLLISMHSVHSDSCGPAIFHQSAAQHFYTANVEMELDSGVRSTRMCIPRRIHF